MKRWLPYIGIVAPFLVATAIVLFLVFIWRAPDSEAPQNEWPDHVRLRCEFDFPNITPGFRVVDLECVVLSGDGP